MKYFIKTAMAMRYGTKHGGKRFIERADLIGDDFMEIRKFIDRLGGSSTAPLKNIGNARLHEKLKKVRVLENNVAVAESTKASLPVNASVKAIRKANDRIKATQDILEDQAKIRIDHGEARAILSVSKHKTQKIRGFTEVSAQPEHYLKKLKGKTEPDDFTGEFWEVKKKAGRP
ncbi:MAG: hypothetical protein HN708_04670 [Candidatus Marinimicrobia bacterium]|jgi:hypothetical protein|nr:hypothetical protein [Candidatus Neomarinimicrobiota bacterium]